MSAPPDQYLTIVFLNPEDASALIRRPDSRALSWSHALRELEKAEDQRDELAAALRDLLAVQSDGKGVYLAPLCESGGDPSHYARTLNRASAALAKVQS